jgi:hypothetical protein
MIQLLERLPDGSLVHFYGTVSPSLPCPRISITRFDIGNIRKDPIRDYGYLCDVTVAGTVNSLLCDVLPGEDGTISEVRFFHNDGETQTGVFPVTGEKSTSDDIARPFPYDGRFHFTASGVPVFDGVNIFEITSRDRIYGLDGHSKWSASFALPYEDEFDIQDDEPVQEPTLVDPPTLLSGGTTGELSLYSFGLKSDGSKDQDFRLVLPGGRTFRFSSILGTDILVPVWQDSAAPVLFTLRPTMAIKLNAPSTSFVTTTLDSNPALGSLSPADRFRCGFSFGIGFEGYDMVFDAGMPVKNGAKFSKDLRSIGFDIRVANTAGRTLQREATVDITKPLPSPPSVPPSGMPDLMWHFASLFRTSDPRADQVVVALLIGDLSEVGLKKLVMEDWRTNFYICFAEIMEELIKLSVNESEAGQGFCLGRAMGDALRTHVDPTLSDRIDEIGKAGFLLRLSKMPYFNPFGRAGYMLGRLATWRA